MTKKHTHRIHAYTQAQHFVIIKMVPLSAHPSPNSLEESKQRLRNDLRRLNIPLTVGKTKQQNVPYILGGDERTLGSN